MSCTASIGARFTLVLTGFRNDLARRRVLAFLQERIETSPAERSLPFTLLGQADLETGTRLSAELRELGAIVRLTRLDDDHEPAPPLAAVVPEAPAAVGPWPVSPRRVVRLLGLALRVPMLVVLGMAVIFTLRLRQIGEDLAELERATPIPRDRVTSARVPSPRVSRGYIKSLIIHGDSAAALQAIERDPEVKEDPTVLALKGDAYVKMSDWERARVAYERAVALDSKDPQVFVALAGIYRQQGRQTAAVDMLHRAKENGASGSDFESLVRVVVAEQDAESNFSSATSPHFTVSFDEGEDQAAARLVLSHLEDAYWTVGQKLEHYPNHRTPVVLYAAQDFQQVTHSPGWAGALYDGRIKVPVRGLHGSTPGLAKTLRHEYAHALVVSIAGPRCPVWLNEGVAMWAEDEEDGEREDWAFGAIRLSQAFGLARLERSFLQLSDRQAVAAYAQSYLAVRHIVTRYGQLPLRKLLTAFASTASTADAFRAVLSIELSTFEDELRFERDSVG